jgi:protein-tyrosine phosphatase
MRILFVCLGNICRSPTAEAVMRSLTEEAGLADEITIDSAGTGDWHIGHPPDPRAVEAGSKRGLAVAGTARQVAPSDLENFDLIVAMDNSNRIDLIELAGEDDSRIRLLREFGGDEDPDVPDPYLGDDGFDEVVDLIERHCRALLLQVAPAR